MNNLLAIILTTIIAVVTSAPVEDSSKVDMCINGVSCGITNDFALYMELKLFTIIINNHQLFCSCHGSIPTTCMSYRL